MLSDLTHITTCPDCKEKSVDLELRRNQHSNGHWTEERLFRCGYRVVYSPNYCKSIKTDNCGKDPSHLKILDKRKTAEARLKQYISTLDVDATYKDAATREIHSMFVGKMVL